MLETSHLLATMKYVILSRIPELNVDSEKLRGRRMKISHRTESNSRNFSPAELGEFRCHVSRQELAINFCCWGMFGKEQHPLGQRGLEFLVRDSVLEINRLTQDSSTT